MDRRQQEAFINEYKGNLFEFLVGRELAIDLQIFPHFYNAITPEYLELLNHYEIQLREIAPQLLSKLPLLAQQSALILLERYEHISAVELVGKDARQNNRAEGDLKIFEFQTLHLLSLKLAKKKSQVNTKSGGIKSFIRNYFSTFTQAKNLQLELNRLVEQGFITMLHQLYSSVGIDFVGEYDDQWIAAGFSELPGQLPEQQQAIVYEYYALLAAKLYSLLYQLYQSDPQKFARSLLPIIGLGDEKVDQLFVYHSDHKFSSFLFQSGWSQMKQSLSFKAQQVHKSLFSLQWGDKLIHIRVKPMNKFIQASLKVNCTVTNS